MNSIKKLKVAIIVDNTDQPFLIYDLYKRSLESDRYSIDYLIVQEINNIKKKTLFNKLTNYLKSNGIIKSIDRIIFEVIDQLETQIIKKKKNLRNFLSKNQFQNLKLKKFLLTLIFHLQACIINIIEKI